MAKKRSRGEIEWQVEGDFFSGCNCRSLLCPCLFVGNPDEGDCEQTYAWHIETGHYGPVQVDGLNLVGMFYAPGHLVTGPRWQAALYLDRRASPEQAEALRKIFSGQAGGYPGNIAAFVGEWLGFRAAPIEYEAHGKHRGMHIPDILDLAVDGLAGGDPNRDVCIINTSLTLTPGFDVVLARSTRYTYHDHGRRWDNSGRFGGYSRFMYTSK